MTLRFLLLLLLYSTAIQPLGAQDAVKERLKRSYHTEPHTLPKGEKYDKYDAEIIAIWEDSKKRPEEYANALKALLQQDGMTPYFYYDGAAMLLSIKVSAEHLKLAAESMARCDVRSVGRDHFVKSMVAIGASGMDVSAAVLRILEEDGFQAFITGHFLLLGQDWSFMIAASQVPPETMLKAIRNRMKTKFSDTARSTLADWAWHAATSETDKLFAELWPELSEGENKERFRRMAARMRPGKLSEADQKKLDELREKRKPLMGSMSDEGLDIARTVTNEMRAILGDVKEPAKQQDGGTRENK